VNPGPTEEIGKVANTFMDSLKSQPLSLALVVMNAMLLGYIYYTETRYVEGRRIAFTKIVEQQQNMAELLAHCIPADDIKKLMEGLGLRYER
jgi:predicted DNA-binding protein (UPF0278 family)